MRTVFFGSSEFSIPCLVSIQKDVVAVVTKKARPKGRGYLIEDNQVKKLAQDLRLPLFELETPKDEVLKEIEQFKPELFVIASFGFIIPGWVLAIPSLGPINVHPSLLPRYRGASPMQWALLNGDTETGITIIEVIEKMDAGKILYQEKARIKEDDNIVTLSARLSARSGEILPGLIEEFERTGIPEGTVQDEARATYTRIVTKEMAVIDWERSAREILQKIRAFTGSPTAYTSLDGKYLKIFEAVVFDIESEEKPGTIIGVTKDGFLVATGSRVLLVLEVQLENKKKMSASQFANGYRKLAGKVLQA